MKTCNKCGIEKEETEYLTRIVNGKRYLRTYCKPCWNKRSSERPGHSEKPSKAKYYQKRKKLRADGDFDVCCRAHLQDCRSSDKRKGRENDLTIEFILDTLSKPCSYCEVPDGRMSLDRIDNSIGHLQTNVVSSCARCNLTRGSMPYEAWLVVSPGMKTARLAGLFGDWRGDGSWGTKS